MQQQINSLILETSGRVGQVALAYDTSIEAACHLDEARRHARDLAPAVAELLAQQSLQPADIHLVIVSLGPGSYTGLRVGIMSAKAFAYATGCRLAGVKTFDAIAEQATIKGDLLDVIADAQQDRIYVQRFARSNPCYLWHSVEPLSIRPFSEWLVGLDGSAAITGPGLRGNTKRLPPQVKVVDPEHWDPQPYSLVRLGLGKYGTGHVDDLLTLEPIYLRPSAAEQQWKAGSGA